jgi:hypothetical protein
MCDPGGDFLSYRRALAVAIRAFPAALTRCAVEEILLHRVADVAAEFGRSAGDLTAGIGTGVGVVALGVGTHDGFALEIAGCALA